MTLLPDLRTGILLVQRARHFSTGFWLLVVVVGVSIMAAQFSGRQPATVALDVGLSAMRLLLPLLIVISVQELFSREFDRRYFLASLTYPRPRHRLLLGRMASVLLLVYTVQLLVAIVLALAVAQISQGYEQATPVDLGPGYWITHGHLAIDLFVLTAVAVLLSLMASTPSFVLIGTLGFMLMARSYSNVIALLESKRYLLENTETYQQSLSVMNFLIPDLAAIDVRTISLYGKPDLLPADWFANLAACVMYGVALIALSLFVLQRKQFN